MEKIEDAGTGNAKEPEAIKTEIVIVKPAGLYALKQLGQDILNAVEKYEKSVKKESKDGK